MATNTERGVNQTLQKRNSVFILMVVDAGSRVPDGDRCQAHCDAHGRHQAAQGLPRPQGPGHCGDQARHFCPGVQEADQQGRVLRVPGPKRINIIADMLARIE